MVFQTEGSTAPPKTAIWLGALGLMPFAALTATALIGDGTSASTALFAVVVYGAVILSFLGGAHWGFASAGMKYQPAAAPPLLVMSVVPSLLGWVAVLLPMPWSAAVLATAFLAILPLDRWALTHDFAPRWWLRLRIPLSATVSTLLFLASVSDLPTLSP